MKEIEEFHPILGEAKPEWEPCSFSNENGLPELNPFVFRVFSSDPSHLTFHVTDFRSYTWESRRSFHQLEDMRDSIGIGGSWSDFMNYVAASLKSKDVKLVMEWLPKSNGAVSAKLVCCKSKGMPLLSVSLSKLGHSTASEAMANLSLELFKAYNLLHSLLAKEQERSCQLTQVISTEKDKSQALKRKLDTTIQLEKQGFQKAIDIGSTISPLNFEDKHPAEIQSTEAAHLAVPAFRRAEVIGVVLHDAEEEEGSLIASEVQIIEGGEGKMKKKKWTRNDDLALISAWLNTSKVPVIGTNQPGFWKQISQKVSDNTGEKRIASQCKSHWTKTVKKVSHFCGCYQRARDLNRSGWSDMNYIEEAESIYAYENQGKPFNYRFWWEQLKDEVKWNDMYMQDYGLKKTKINVSSACTTSCDGNDNVNSSQGISQKAAKKNEENGKINGNEEFSKNVLELESRKMLAMGNLAYTQVVMAEAKAKKAEALRAQAETQKFTSALEFLNKDASNMSDEQRAKHERLCDILRAQIFGM